MKKDLRQPNKKVGMCLSSEIFVANFFKYVALFLKPQFPLEQT